jgi:Glycosyl hydrolases family 16
MPTGCGVWPAFWLTDEANWPLHGEIDIVESVNYLSTAKTALHSTKGCSMADIPLGTMTGGWDTAQGIPNGKTGIPDMTLRYARDCFVYNPHQWLNQGCVAVDTKGESLGEPLNRNGGGIFALEWDPINRHIRSWVFTPHTAAPENIIDAIRTASLADQERILPDPDLWPIPYAYFAIGVGTDCSSSHFRQMRLVFNTAFCGSVAGNRFHLDCPAQAKQFDTCNEWIKSDPAEMMEAYWKIRGVYVYERAWKKTWLNR